MLPEGVICRRATPGDHRAVVGIRAGALWGVDYMDWAYPHYISNPNVHAFVLEKYGLMMAFIYAYIVDGGRSVIRGGGRTRDGHGGKKYLKILKDYLHQQLQRILTQSTCYTYTALESSFHLNRLEEQRNAYTLLLRRNIISYTFPLKKAIPSTEAMKMKALSQIWRPNEEEFTRMMQREDTTKVLFPHGYIINDWEPYAVIEENISLVYRTSVIRVSGSKTDSQYSAISFNVHQLCTIGLVIQLDFFGNPTCLMAHVLASIQYLASGQSCSNPELQVTLIIYYPEEIDPHIPDVFGRKVGWKPGPLGSSKRSILVASPAIILSAKL